MQGKENNLRNPRLNPRNQRLGMSVIVKTIARLITGFIFLYGVYVTLHGHLTPGGGFAGGVIIGGSFVLLVIAYGSEQVSSKVNKMRASLGEAIGILIFWTLGILGLLVGAYFLANFLGKGKPFHIFSAGIIPICNIGIGIEVGGALFAIFITLTIFKKGKKK